MRFIAVVTSVDDVRFAEFTDRHRADTRDVADASSRPKLNLCTHVTSATVIRDVSCSDEQRQLRWYGRQQLTIMYKIACDLKYMYEYVPQSCRTLWI